MPHASSSRLSHLSCLLPQSSCMKPLLTMSHFLLLARITLLSSSSLAVEAFFAPHSRATVTTSQTAPKPFVTIHRETHSKNNRYSKYKRLKSYNNDDNNDESVDKERKEKYLSLAEQAWTQFFAKERSTPLDISSTATSDGDDKEDYLKMALDAWDSASSNNYRNDAMIVDNLSYTVEDVEYIKTQKDPGNKQNVSGKLDKSTTQDSTTGDSNSMMEMATSRMFGATSALFGKLWGGKTGIANGNDDSSQSSSSNLSSRTAKSYIQEEKESIPYGFRAEASTNTNITPSEAETSNASNKPYFMKNDSAETNYSTLSSSKTKTTNNSLANKSNTNMNYISSGSSAMKGIPGKQKRNTVNSVDSFSTLGLKGQENAAEPFTTINSLDTDRQEKRTTSPSNNFQEVSLKKQSQIDSTLVFKRKSNNLGSRISSESIDGGILSKKTSLDDADIDYSNNSVTADESNKLEDTDTKPRSNFAHKLKIDKTKLVGIGARESILTSDLKSQKNRFPAFTSIAVNDADMDNKAPTSETSNLITDRSMSLKGVSYNEYAPLAKQLNEKSPSSSFGSLKGAAAPSEKDLIAQSFRNTLKTPKLNGVDIEENSDIFDGSSSALSEGSISTSPIKNSPDVTSLNRGSPNDSAPSIEQPESGNTFQSSLNSPKGSPVQKQLIARSYLNSLKISVEKKNSDEERSEFAKSDSSSQSKFSVGSTFSPSSKSPLKGSNPSIMTSSNVDKAALNSAFSRKDNIDTTKRIYDYVPALSNSKEDFSLSKKKQFLKAFSPEKIPKKFVNTPTATVKGKESLAFDSGSDVSAVEGVKGAATATAGLGILDENNRMSKIVGPSILKEKMKTKSSGALGSVNTKSPVDDDELMMKINGPPGKTFALNRQTASVSGTSAVQGLKGSDSAPNVNTPFGSNELKSKISGLPATNSLASKQPAVNATRTSFTAGLKGSDSVKMMPPSGMRGPKIKLGAPFPDKKAINARTFDGTVGSGFSNALLKGYSPKQTSFNSISLKDTPEAGRLPVAKGFSDDLKLGVVPSLNGNSALVRESRSEANAADTSGKDPFFKGDNEVQDIDDTTHPQNFVASTYEPLSVFASDANEEVFEANEDFTVTSPQPTYLHDIEVGEGEPIFENTKPDDFTVLFRNIDAKSLPLLRVGARVYSSVYGATHQGYLVIAKDNDEGFNILPCTAKRPWTMAELKSNVVAEVTTGVERGEPPEDWEIQMNAATIRNYFEVEYHCYQKFDQMKQLRMLRRRQTEADRASNNHAQTENDAAASNSDVLDCAVPKFLGIYQDDGEDTNGSDQDVWGKSLDNSYEWMVYSGGGIEGIQASLDQHIAVSQDDPHHLYSVQKALNLPESLQFGDVMDVLMLSLLENLVFLTSCNVVHRDIKLSNINCDFENQRLQLINFGSAVDLDPKEGKRVGLETRSSNTVTPVSIANSFAEDSFSTAMVLCQLLFNLMDDASVKNFQDQIKGASYDLDSWLKNQLENSGNEYSPEDIPALEYLGERRGAWGLLKRLIQPNPLQRKLAVNSLIRLKEIMGLRDGTIKWTDDFIVKVATEEGYLETLIDKFGQDLKDVDNISDSSRGNVDSDTAPCHAPIESTEHVSKSELIPGHEKVEQAVSYGAPVTPTPVRNTVHRDVYYDITRSKLTSKFPPSRPSVLSSLLSSGIRSVSPPATATEIAAQQNMKVYDITRASLSAVNPYSTFPLKQDVNQPTKEFSENKEGSSSERNDAVLTSSPSTSTTEISSRKKTRVSLEKSEEVGRWILSYLPRLQKQDLQFYAKCFIADGFDSYDMLRELDVDDLDFMKKGHRRVLVRKLEVERKLDSELDPSSRKRIELLLVEASSKRIPNKEDAGVLFANSTPTPPTVDSTRMSYLASRPYDLKGSTREEEAMKLVANQNKTTEEAIFSVPVGQTVPNDKDRVSTPESMPLAYDIFEAEEELEEENNRVSGKGQLSDISRVDRLRLNVASSSTSPSEQNITNSTSRSVPASTYNIIQAGEELKEVEAWIEEQNLLVDMRRGVRSNPQFFNTQRLGEMPNEIDMEVKPTSRGVDSKDDLNSTAVNSVKIFSTNVDVVQSRFSGEVSEEDRSAWYKEQNILVEKRRLARIEEERRLREKRS